MGGWEGVGREWRDNKFIEQIQEWSACLVEKTLFYPENKHSFSTYFQLLYPLKMFGKSLFGFFDPILLRS